MNPFFFGTSGSQLFGAYDAPAADARYGAVLCYPLAWEYMRAHGTFRYLARQLAAAGYHVLRFDYSGTGDSAGDCEEVASAELWIADVHAAIDELRDVAQVRQVALIGLRFGAVLAALASRGRNDVSRLVLWEPVVDGATYLASLEEHSELRQAGTKAASETRGVPLAPQIRRDIESISLECFSSNLPPTLLLTTGESESTASAMRGHLSAAKVELTSIHAQDVPVWAAQEGVVAGGMPVTSVRAIVDWLR